MPPDFTATDLAELLSSLRKNIDRELTEQGGTAALSPADQQTIAIAQTQQAFERAGITDSKLRGDTEARIQEYMSLGVSPRTAASAAASSVLSPAAPSAGEFAVEGKVIKEVKDKSVYHFNSTEHLHVLNSAIHNHFGKITYEVGTHDVEINCETITTASTLDWGRSHWGTAIGEYPGSYESTTGMSATAYLAVTKWGGTNLAFSVATGMLAAFRTQSTVIEAEGIGFSKTRAKSLVEATLINVAVAQTVKVNAPFWSIK
ncbi:hypothetical protein [Bordetella muralis]|uniref:hypothetical protein n=1 Tax=Bordetella muralis TaxID=1649130 RepID=UPI0039EE41A4